MAFLGLSNSGGYGVGQVDATSYSLVASLPVFWKCNVVIPFVSTCHFHREPLLVYNPIRLAEKI